jgi:hypothetical protein
MSVEIIKDCLLTQKNLQEKFNLLPNSLKRKTPEIFQLAYLATKDVIENQAEKPQAIICVSMLGCLNETVSFLDKLQDTNFGSPKDFVYSVHNSLGAMLAKEFEILGPNLAIVDKNIDSAKTCAEILDEQTVLLVFFDDKNEFAQNILKKCGRQDKYDCPYVNVLLCSKGV